MSKRRKQCEHCPWKVGADPACIPNEYDEAAHRKLHKTIADPNHVDVNGPLRIMACHESHVGRELPCVGWMYNQYGDGNNVALRHAVATGRLSLDIDIDGPQHKTFEQTLPKAAKASKRGRRRR